MTDNPQYAGQFLPAARPRLSGASLTSLILGILLCIPLVTSVGAILFAIAGLRATRNVAVRGRGLAAAGLTLGIIGVVFWGAIGIFISFIVAASAAPRAALQDFGHNLGTGNLAAAAAQCGPPISAADVDKMHAYIVPFGTYEDLTCTSAYLQSGSAGQTCRLSGSMHFSGGARPFSSTLVKDAAGMWKVYGIHIF